MYEGVRQYCSKTRLVTSHCCTAKGAANSRKDALSSGVAESSVSLGRVSLRRSSSRWTSWYSGLSRQVWCQSTSVCDPGAAPMTSNIHSAKSTSVLRPIEEKSRSYVKVLPGLASEGQAWAPFLSKYFVRIEAFSPTSPK